MHILIAGARLACTAHLTDTARPHYPGLSIRFRGAGCAVPVGIFLIGGIEINLELEMAGSPCMPPLTPLAPVADLSQPRHDIVNHPACGIKVCHVVFQEDMHT